MCFFPKVCVRRDEEGLSCLEELHHHSGAEQHVSLLCLTSVNCVLFCSKTPLVNQPVFCWFLLLLKRHP